MVLPVTTTLAPIGSQSSKDPLNALANDPYAINQIRYPLSGIGTTDVPSHVVFYINLPTSSKYLTANPGSATPDKSQSTKNYDTLSSQGGVYKPITTQSNVAAGSALTAITKTLQSGLGAGFKSIVGSAEAGEVAETLVLRPNLTRINTTIAIYMPDTVTASYDHNWGEVSATNAYGDVGRAAALGASASGIIDEVTDAVKTLYNNVVGSGDEQPKKFNKPATAEIAGRIAEASGSVGSGFTDLYLKSQGVAVNPHTEMIFQGTGNRSFVLVFDLIPRSQQEAVAVYNIVKTFKGFAAPEVTAIQGGRYFIPPAQFDIKFYFQNVENPAIFKISTCVLTNINAEYNGSGGPWASFADGSPLHVKLTLTFKETDVITRELIEQEGY